jgi:glycosyltransferase involved in cell wall biosynthesis
MRIMFLCGSLEQGRDGVGDYVRQLSFALAETDHEVAMVAINDRHIPAVQDESIVTGGKMIKMLRMPEAMDEVMKQQQLKTYINAFEPDCLSLQYVPFSFHPKGLGFGLAAMLKDIADGVDWHLMVHEIAVGMDVKSDLKMKTWGWLQQYLLRDLVKTLKPAVIHTHVPTYKKQMEAFEMRVKILPLFSNIPVLYPEKVKEKIAAEQVLPDTIELVVFASIQENAPINQLAREAAAYGKQEGKKIKLVFLGRSGREQQHWIAAWQSAGLEVELIGEQNPDQVSAYLTKARYGIFTTPALLAGKSGAVAAMREHGLDLLCVARSWSPRGLFIDRNDRSFDVFEYKEGNLPAFLNRRPDFAGLPTLPVVAAQMVKDLLEINVNVNPLKMKVIISHPTGNVCSRSAAKGLLESNVLNTFYTTVATFPGGIFDQLSKIKSFSELNRRRYDPSLQSHTRSWPWLELGRIAASKAGFKGLTTHEHGRFSVDAVYEDMDKRVAGDLKRKIAKCHLAVYAYEDGALHSFTEAKRLGVTCLYDLPIGYWRSARELLKSEIERWPEWKSTLTNFRDSDEKLARKDEELKLADRIYVASSFTAKTLADYPGTLAPIEVLPYGFPPVVDNRVYSNPNNRPIKLLFVGGLSQRKGIADVFEAVKNIGPAVELTVVGRKTNADCAALDEALARHTWIPSLPHEEVLELMREHDVLLFPSLFEGFGMVITEAMSQGTPVITTDRTVGPDLIVHDQNGWIIPAGSTSALQEQIEKLLAAPEKIATAGIAAMETAKKRPFVKYGEDLAKLLVDTFK